MSFLKRLAYGLPPRYQQELKRLHFARMIRQGRFESAIENEGEFARLHLWVQPGDWVLDLGANVGNYAARLSRLVGARGRVLAFEPVPQTFELLAANVARFPHRNVTLFNIAASDAFGQRSMHVPLGEGGEINPYMAHLTDAGELPVICVPIDNLQIAERIALIKVDVEGHEAAALRGLRRTLGRDRPVLIIEGTAAEVEEELKPLGYSFEQDPGSPNRVFRVNGGPAR